MVGRDACKPSGWLEIHSSAKLVEGIEGLWREHEPPGTSVEAEKATEALVFSLRRATMGRDKGSVSELILLGRAIDEAEAAGADAGKLRVAREVVEREGKLPEDPAVRFW